MVVSQRGWCERGAGYALTKMMIKTCYNNLDCRYFPQQVQQCKARLEPLQPRMAAHFPYPSRFSTGYTSVRNNNGKALSAS